MSKKQVTVRFSYDGTDVDLYEEETPQVELQIVRPIDLIHDPDYGGMYMGMFYTGQKYRKINVYVQPCYTGTDGTITRLETVWGWYETYGQPSIIQCYYKYRIDSTAHYWVQMKRETMRWYYSMGHEEVPSRPLKLEFVETRPEGVGVIYKPDDLVGT